MSHHSERQQSVTEGPKPDDWGRHRDLITRLYMNEDWTLTSVQKYMQENFDFTASTKMYKSRFKQWNLHKKRKRPEMAFASRTLQRRDRDGKDTVFVIRNRRLTRQNVNAYRLRLTDSEAAELDEGQAGATPPDINYYTPPPGSPSQQLYVGTDTRSETTASTEDMLAAPAGPSRHLADARIDEDESMVTPTRTRLSDPKLSLTSLNAQPTLGRHENMFGHLQVLLTSLALEPQGQDTTESRPTVLPLRDYIAHTAGLSRGGHTREATILTGRAIATLPSNLRKDLWLVLFELCQSAGDLACSVSHGWFRSFLHKYHETCISQIGRSAGPWQELAAFSMSMVHGYDTSTSLQVQQHIHQFLIEHRGMPDRMSIVALFDYAFALLREGGECVDHAKTAFEHVIGLDQNRAGSDGLLVISSLDYLFHIALRMDDDVAARQILDIALQKAQSLPEIYWRRWYLCCMLNGCALLRHQDRREDFASLARQTRLQAQSWVTNNDPFIMEIGRSTQWL